MKKLVSFLIIVTIILSLSSCGNSGPVLKVFNWGEYMDPEVIEIFEEETGIHILLALNATNCLKAKSKYLIYITLGHNVNKQYI